MKKIRPLNIIIIISPLFLILTTFLAISLYGIFNSISKNNYREIWPLLFSSLFFLYLNYEIIRIYKNTYIYKRNNIITISQMGIAPILGNWRTAGYHFNLKQEVIDLDTSNIKTFSFKKEFPKNRYRFRTVFLRPVCFHIRNGDDFLWETAWYSKNQYQSILEDLE